MWISLKFVQNKKSESTSDDHHVIDDNPRLSEPFQQISPGQPLSVWTVLLTLWVLLSSLFSLEVKRIKTWLHDAGDSRDPWPFDSISRSPTIPLSFERVTKDHPKNVTSRFKKSAKYDFWTILLSDKDTRIHGWEYQLWSICMMPIQNSILCVILVLQDNSNIIRIPTTPSKLIHQPNSSEKNHVEIALIQENYNTPRYRTPVRQSPVRQLWKESLYSQLVKVARGVFQFGVLKQP